MLKSSTNSHLSRAMPLIILACLGLLLLQVILIFVVFAPYCQKILIQIYLLLSWARPSYLPFSALFLSMAIWGAIFDLWASHLSQKGLFLRNGFITSILRKFTNREKLDEMLSYQQREARLDAVEFSAILRAKIIGQDNVCDTLSHQLRRRLTLRSPKRPIAVFLFAGPKGTGKKSLAAQLSAQTLRPLFQFDLSQISGEQTTNLLFNSHHLDGLAAFLLNNQNAIVLLNEIQNVPSDILKRFLTAWNEGYLLDNATGNKILLNDALFILTANLEPSNQNQEMQTLEQAGLPPELLARTDSVFTFRPLDPQTLAQITALEVEKLIASYGLQVEKESVDPELIFQTLSKEPHFDNTSSPRDLARLVEDMIGESLILARQTGARKIRLEQGTEGIIATASFRGDF
ncbi:ATP-dependent Clp protease ATP-binding subunit [Acetobacteraceae bacterium]|nr:ATP-dependent Clp protease ATP-binding subunit [Acetobacteraceae bacterium]